MSESGTLDARLAAIDARLRELQDEVEQPREEGEQPREGGEEPWEEGEEPQRARMIALAPPRPVPPPATDAEATASGERMLARLGELGEAHERLLALHRELLTQYAALLEQRAGETAPAEVLAGPFRDGAALRAFERDLAALPDVTEVAVREFPGADRVAFEVRLAPG